MRFPKYFHPVGTSKNSSPRSLATRSNAPLVGMLRATPYTCTSWETCTLCRLDTDFDKQAASLYMHKLAAPAHASLPGSYGIAGPCTGLESGGRD